ncbi:MAG: XdhC family protein [Actinomycetota bacterium]|nr:XdhC family protein [Actinomycetota bacterium]
MRELLAEIDAWRREGRAAALVRAIGVSGFGAAQYESSMVVADGGRRAGSLLRDAVDASVAPAIGETLGTARGRALSVQLATPQAGAAGLSCGGSATVVVEPLESLPALLFDSVAAGCSFVVATTTVVPDAPRSLVVTADATDGTLGAAGLDAEVIEAARALLDSPREVRRLLETGDGAAVHLERLDPRTRVVVAGGGEVADALGEQARTLGWLVDLVPDEAAIDAAGALGAADALVVTTHHPIVGPDALLAGLRSGAFFIGALGSRRTQATRAERLRASGATDDDLDRVHGPVGLDLGGRTPAETALAICAEILAVRAGRDLSSLRDTSGPINR